MHLRITRNLWKVKTECSGVSIRTLRALMNRMVICFTMAIKLGLVCFKEVFFLLWFRYDQIQHVLFGQALSLRHDMDWTLRLLKNCLSMRRCQRESFKRFAACGRLSCNEFACPATGPFDLFDLVVPSHLAIRQWPSCSHHLRPSPSHQLPAQCHLIYCGGCRLPCIHSPLPGPASLTTAQPLTQMA